MQGNPPNAKHYCAWAQHKNAQYKAIHARWLPYPFDPAASNWLALGPLLTLWELIPEAQPFQILIPPPFCLVPYGSSPKHPAIFLPSLEPSGLSLKSLNSQGGGVEVGPPRPLALCLARRKRQPIHQLFPSSFCVFFKDAGSNHLAFNSQETFSPFWIQPKDEDYAHQTRTMKSSTQDSWESVPPHARKTKPEAISMQWPPNLFPQPQRVLPAILQGLHPPPSLPSPPHLTARQTSLELRHLHAPISRLLIGREILYPTLPEQRNVSLAADPTKANSPAKVASK